MNEFSLHSQITYDTVAVPALFIEHMMPSANGEYVKVYLYFLRLLQAAESSLSINAVADLFETTESDILRALTYWEKEGLLKLVFNSSHALTDVTLFEIPEKKPPVLKIPRIKPVQEKVSPIKAQAAETARKLSEDASFAELLKLAQMYFKKTFKAADCDILGYWYQMFHQSYDIIEYLVEYCAEQGHTNMKYLEAVALGWHEQGLLDVDQIKDYSQRHTKTAYSIMKALGLSRSPAPAEQTFIKNWMNTFSLELILTACDRTILQLHKPDFRYTDGILEGWHKAGAKTPEQVALLDKEHQTKTAARRLAEQKGPVKRGNQFHNFEQRDTNYDELVANFYGYRQ